MEQQWHRKVCQPGQLILSEFGTGILWRIFYGSEGKAEGELRFVSYLISPNHASEEK
jgi:hypothetical protein